MKDREKDRKTERYIDRQKTGRRKEINIDRQMDRVFLIHVKKEIDEIDYR